MHGVPASAGESARRAGTDQLGVQGLQTLKLHTSEQRNLAMSEANNLSASFAAKGHIVLVRIADELPESFEALKSDAEADVTGR
jgi:hypothetical protein